MKESNRPKMSFTERVVYMVRNYYEYGYYGKNRIKAVKLLHKYHPKEELRKCQREFDKYLALFEEIVVFVKQNKDYYWQRRNTKLYDRESEIEKQFFKKHSKIPKDIIKWLILWIFDWHHVR